MFLQHPKKPAQPKHRYLRDFYNSTYAKCCILQCFWTTSSKTLVFTVFWKITCIKPCKYQQILQRFWTMIVAKNYYFGSVFPQISCGGYPQNSSKFPKPHFLLTCTYFGGRRHGRNLPMAKATDGLAFGITRHCRIWRATAHAADPHQAGVNGQRRTWPLQKQQDFTMKTPSKRPKQNKLETTSWSEHRSIITNSMVRPPRAQVRMNDPHQAGVNGQRRTWRKDIGATSEQYLRWEETWLLIFD